MEGFLGRRLRQKRKQGFFYYEVHNIDYIHLWPYALILGIGRIFDLVSTWCASPNLTLEFNAWMRKLGWTKVILLNLVLIIMGPIILGKSGCIFIGALSMFLALRNIGLSWIARAIGETGYQDSLSRWLRSAPISVLLLSILCEVFICIIVGGAIADGSLIRKHEKLWYLSDIGRALIFYGFFIGFLHVVNLLRQRRQRQVNQERMQ